MGNARVDADHDVEIFDQRRKFSEIGNLRAELAHAVPLGGGVVFHLQVDHVRIGLYPCASVAASRLRHFCIACRVMPDHTTPARRCDGPRNATAQHGQVRHEDTESAPNRVYPHAQRQHEAGQRDLKIRNGRGIARRDDLRNALKTCSSASVGARSCRITLCPAPPTQG